MKLLSINPATGETLRDYEPWDASRLESALDSAASAARMWADVPLSERAELMREAARILTERCEEFARLMSLEMGKLIGEARAEIEKCVRGCEYYAEHSAGFLADEVIETDAGRSYVAYAPLGVVLAVMPWNFPFWQVLRAAVPALMAGNVVLLKHAANVTGCALAVEDVFRSAGFPESVFRTLVITNDRVPVVVADPGVHGVTLTGSERAGREVGKCAGEHLKKCVLELGGSDAFIVLEDADLDWTVAQAVASRYQNAGQSCIAAKRLIVVEAIAEVFLERLKAAVEMVQPGDPLDEHTTLAPLARADLREKLHRQVRGSLAAGAVAVAGCTPLEGPGAFYAASILDRVRPGMPAFDEELFGPVAAVVRACDEAEAVHLANRSRYGLGGSVWTSDLARGERIARQLECGPSFVNGLVKSDPRLPFGGIKASGHGRELSYHGMHEFTNIKSIWIR
jgi:succinate-semialdehyde dehydrogenase/glutarate-semialdehyde dehydrogenase